MGLSSTLVGGICDHPFLILFCLFVLGVSYLFVQDQLALSGDFPTINDFPNDWTRRKAKAAFTAKGGDLIVEGFQKFNKPFRVITALGSKVILPPAYADWVKKCPDLSHQALVADEFFAGYPGFEAVTMVSHPSELLISMIKTKMSQAKYVNRFRQFAAESLDDFWKDEKEWHEVSWAREGTEMIGRMSSSVFVGEELARDKDWQQISVDYSVNMFMATRALRSWPTWTRPLVHWVVPECRKCRKEVKRGRTLINKVVKQRAQEIKTYEDSMTWMQEKAKGQPYDPAAAQLGLAMAATITTSELLKQALIDICAHSDLIAPLRKEIDDAIEQHGWSAAGLFQMRLLDSVIKESQRLNPLGEVNLDRKAVKDVVLPTGQVLRRGTDVSVHTAGFRDANVYDRPEEFDGYRFLKFHEQSGKWESASSAVSTSPDHFVFGLGKYICPGRFFAVAEVKTALAVILREYDVRLHAEYRPKLMRFGFEILVDPAVRLEVKKR